VLQKLANCEPNPQENNFKFYLVHDYSFFSEGTSPRKTSTLVHQQTITLSTVRYSTISMNDVRQECTVDIYLVTFKLANCEPNPQENNFKFYLVHDYSFFSEGTSPRKTSTLVHHQTITISTVRYSTISMNDVRQECTVDMYLVTCYL
jgi:thiaminase